MDLVTTSNTLEAEVEESNHETIVCFHATFHGTGFFYNGVSVSCVGGIAVCHCFGEVYTILELIYQISCQTFSKHEVYSACHQCLAKFGNTPYSSDGDKAWIQGNYKSIYTSDQLKN